MYINIHVYLQCMDTAHDISFTLYRLCARMIRNQLHAHEKNLKHLVLPQLKCHSLMKEHPWAKHLTSPPERGVGALSNTVELGYQAHIHYLAHTAC